MSINLKDFTVGIDPTAFTSITGEQLATLVNSAAPQIDKGLTVLTTDIGVAPVVPDPDDNAAWKRYLWIRQSATSVGLYVWNEQAASDATYLKWQSINIAGIGAGSIATSMIQDGAVTDAKILTVDGAKITGTLSQAASNNLLTKASTFGSDGGAITGTYNSLAIGDNEVTTSKINNNAVTTAKILDKNVTVSKIAGTGVEQQLLRTKVGTPLESEFVTFSDVVLSPAVDLEAGNAGKVLAVKSDYSEYECKYTPLVATKATVGTTTNTPGSTSETDVTGLSAVTFTPKSNSHYLEVELSGTVFVSGPGVTYPTVRIYKGVTEVAKIIFLDNAETVGITFPTVLKAIITAPGTSELTLKATIQSSTSAVHTIGNPILSIKEYSA